MNASSDYGMRVGTNPWTTIYLHVMFPYIWITVSVFEIQSNGGLVKNLPWRIGSYFQLFQLIHGQYKSPKLPKRIEY